MEQVVTKLQQQLGAQQQALQQAQAVTDAHRGSAAQRDNALQAQLADMSDRLNLNMAEAQLGVEPAPVARRHRAFIESRAFSKLANFLTPKQVHGRMGHSSSRTWPQPWSRRRESLLNAAQQETPMLTVDDVEAGPDSVEINPQVYVALAELLEGEALDIVQNTARGAGLEAWRKLVRNFDPQTVGQKRTLLSRNINPGTVKVHELSRPIEQWEERVRSCQSRAREKILMTYVPES